VDLHEMSDCNPTDRRRFYFDERFASRTTEVTDLYRADHPGIAGDRRRLRGGVCHADDAFVDEDRAIGRDRRGALDSRSGP